MFIVSLINSSVIKGEFLQPTTLSLVQLGAKYAYDAKQGYIWLFITPVLLHGNFMHIFSNLVSQLIFGTELEKRLGVYKMATLYLVSSISGNLFSCLVTDSVSVGASTAIFGLLASLLGYLIINWDALARYG
jgi:rhomboid protease GluP